MAAQCGDRLGDRRVTFAALHVDMEEVVAERPGPRPRLDAHEVDPAEGELAQAAHEPARRRVARPGEDDRRLPRRRRRRPGRCRPARARRSASRCAGRRRRRRAAPGSRRARRPTAGPSAAHGSSVAATVRTASAVEVVARTTAPGSSARRKRAHWPSGWGCETTTAMPSSGTSSRAIRQLRMSRTVSPTMATSSASSASASSVAVTPPSERVLDRHEGAVDRAVLDGHDRLVDGGEGDELGVGGAHRRPDRLLAEGARGPEVAEPHQRRCSARSGTSPASATRIASCSSGESSSVPSPATTCLAYRRAWSRWWIEETTTPEPRRVEQRDRRRLAAGHLVVGVVAHEAVVGDRALEALLDRAQPALQPGREVLDVGVQRAEVAVQPGGVRGQVARRASPRTTRWSARSRVTRRASTSTAMSATTASTAAADATIPVVVVSSSTTGRISRARGASAGEDDRVALAVVVGLLLAADGGDDDLGGHRLSDRRGGARAGSRPRRASRRSSARPSRRAVIGRLPPRTVTVTRTLRSSFSPWFSKETVNVTPPPLTGTRLTAGEGCSVTSPTETPDRPWP